MIRYATLETARSKAKRFDVEMLRADVLYYFESGPDEPPSGQAFLVEQDPLFSLKAHYHHNHQFQVVARGRGMLGTHHLEPFSVHFASAESGYGPILASGEGLSYFTLRTVPEHGARQLPEEAHLIARGRRRYQRVAQAPALTRIDDLKGFKKTTVSLILKPESNGLGGWMVSVPPGEALTPPILPGGDGRFHVVANGSALIGEEELTELSVIYSSADELDFKVHAGPLGLELLVLQMPRRQC